MQSEDLASKNALEDLSNLSESDQELVKQLGEEWGKELVEEKKEEIKGMTIQDLLASAPRKLRRQLQPDKKFSANLLQRLKTKK